MSTPDEIYAILHTDHAIDLIRIPAEETQRRERMTRFADILARLEYRGGISSPFTNLSQFRSYLSQAKFALEFAQTQGKSDELLLSRSEFSITCCKLREES